MQDVKPSEAVYEYYQKYSWNTAQFDACCQNTAHKKVPVQDLIMKILAACTCLQDGNWKSDQFSANLVSMSKQLPDEQLNKCAK